MRGGGRWEERKVFGVEESIGWLRDGGRGMHREDRCEGIGWIGFGLGGDALRWMGYGCIGGVSKDLFLGCCELDYMEL